MSEKNTVSVLIGGKIIRLSGYEQEEYLQKVASYMNRKMSELSDLKGYNRMAPETKSLLLSLNICDDYYKAKNQAEVYEADLQIKDKEIYDLKQKIVDLEVALQKTRK